VPTASPEPPPATPTAIPTSPATATSAAIDSIDTTEPTPTTEATAETEPTPEASPTPARVSPSRLVIPAINLEAPVITVAYENFTIGGQPVTTWAVPDYFAAGWHHTSAPPGQVGNTVLNGHQNIFSGVFRDLTEIQEDDEIFVYVGDREYQYRVVEKHLLSEEGQPLSVRVENARWIMPTDDERLTLVTCAPDTASTHRLIVVALPVQTTPTPALPIQ
jgi:sortase A